MDEQQKIDAAFADYWQTLVDSAEPPTVDEATAKTFFQGGYETATAATEANDEEETIPSDDEMNPPPVGDMVTSESRRRKRGASAVTLDEARRAWIQKSGGVVIGPMRTQKADGTPMTFREDK